MTWTTPFQYEFMVTAMATAMLVGAVCAVLSCFLVLKGWSLMGDAIAHAVLPGIVLAYATGLPLPLGAFTSGLFCAIGSGFIRSQSRLKEDTVLGVVFTGLFALGLVLFTRIESDQHLTHILFGSLLGIPRSQMIETVLMASSTLAILWLFRRDLMLFCFDAAHARSIGLSPRFLNHLLLALLALTVVTAIRSVGVILVVAMLVTPGCVGHLMADRFPRMMTFAVASAVLASGAGAYASFFLNASTGACIVLAQSFFFVGAFLFAPKRGWMAIRWKRG